MKAVAKIKLTGNKQISDPPECALSGIIGVPAVACALGSRAPKRLTQTTGVVVRIVNGLPSGFGSGA